MPTQLKRYTLTHEGLYINVKEYRASRNIRLIVHNDCTITLTCPPRTAKIMAANYILRNVDWIRHAIAKVSRKVAKPSDNSVSVSPEQTRVLRANAQKYIPQRLQQLATANGLYFEGVTITTTTSRWGSCNGRKQIRISCYVMMLPSELIDLVLLHELAHTVHMNHSPKFHNTLNALLPMHNENELNKKLKQYHITKTKSK
ncbi:MAG: M48 family metallopeptidase [Bacteroidales bacterium]|nr:M48 family metallopeptidase [Bacteroidales bacterium]